MKTDKNLRSRDALQLEDFDILELSKMFPELKIGVNVNRIYIQIAKYNWRSEQGVELQILKNALSNVSNKKHFDSSYAIMTLSDVIKCFGECLNHLPKSTFMLSHIFDSDLHDIT